MNFEKKRGVVRRVRAFLVERFGEEDLHHACGYWAAGVVLELHKMGIRAIIQAGTMQWPVVDVADDDGVGHTHFSYMWEPDHPLTRARIAANLLPEMHIWAAIPDPGRPGRGELVDLTTAYLPRQAREKGGVAWRGKKPPEYLWASRPPDRVVYEVHADATFLAMEYLRREDIILPDHLR